MRYGIHSGSSCHIRRDSTGARWGDGEQNSERACFDTHGTEACGVGDQRFNGWHNMMLAGDSCVYRDGGSRCTKKQTRNLPCRNVSILLTREYCMVPLTPRKSHVSTRSVLNGTVFVPSTLLESQSLAIETPKICSRMLPSSNMLNCTV